MITEQLEITPILDRPISAISGGELQRTAIAAATLKDAQLYMFDEPTSYLDIKQRLNISTYIRNLTNENTMVLAVEHDLIVLDYITDLVHVTYGEETAYGIISGLKSSKEGINVFLSGYLKEENVRFRDYPIKFERTPVVEQTDTTPLCSWNKLKKSQGDFTITAEGGEINKGEIIGIVGENGIGKTTFVKMLAGEMEPDEGDISQDVKISYKPQYLDIREEENEDVVATYLQDAIAKYSNQLIGPLNITPLFTKKLSTLSGGELQRVMVAKALSKEAKLFLLDEPSAYLDVEQRLSLSRTLKKFAEERGATILVVDHDLLFLDYLSNRLLVFTGTPAKEGSVTGPFTMEEGMNHFLKDVGVTFRRDHETGRPRANKIESVIDRQQKGEGKYYYS